MFDDRAAQVSFQTAFELPGNFAERQSGQIGLVFIGATTDKFLRAFDAKSGEEVWTRRLPYTANANPITYRMRADSRQFVVIAAGGHGWSEPGDALMAFALPG